LAGRTRARTASRSPAGGRAAGPAGVASPRSRNGEPWYLSSAAVRGPLGGRASASGRVWPGPLNVTFKQPDKNTRGSSSQGFGEREEVPWSTFCHHVFWGTSSGRAVSQSALGGW